MTYIRVVHGSHFWLILISFWISFFKNDIEYGSENGHFSASFLFFHFLGKFKLHSLYLYHVNCHQCPPSMLPPPPLTPLPPLAPLGGEGHHVALIGHENAHAWMSAFLAIISAILQNYCNLNGAKLIIVYDIGTVTVSLLLPMMRSLGAVFHRL